MSFFSIFFIVIACLIFVSTWIAYIIRSQTPKEPVVWGNESTHPLPTYQIHPTESCDFYIKKWGSFGWTTVKDHANYGGPIRQIFSTQEEAEKWIAKDMLLEEEVLQREIEGKKFVEDNPPYGVPPFRFLKS